MNTSIRTVCLVTSAAALFAAAGGVSSAAIRHAPNSHPPAPAAPLPAPHHARATPAFSVVPIGQGENRTQAPGDAPAAATARARPRVEVVFVLDTTGSMSGLIEAAKQKVWAIANQIVLGEPKPQVRMGLVGYRDRGDSYVTSLTPLTDDLDAVYTSLMAFSAEGGGDFPESVNEALHHAVTAFAWTPDSPAPVVPAPSSPSSSQVAGVSAGAEGASGASAEERAAASSRVLRIIYLVGDAPPHTDYADDVSYSESCRLAASSGIIINTIRCGSNSETQRVWREIARLAEGETFDVDADASAQAVVTPMDEALASLGTELEATVVAYGSREQIAAQTLKDDAAREIASAAPAAALAERTIYKCENLGASLIAAQDLVTDCTVNGIDIGTIPEKDLPENLRAMDASARKEHVEEMGRKRADVQQRISELSRQRRDYIAKQIADRGVNGKGDTFDAAALASLRRQAARAGLTYADVPKPDAPPRSAPGEESKAPGGEERGEPEPK